MQGQGHAVSDIGINKPGSVSSVNDCVLRGGRLYGIKWGCGYSVHHWDPILAVPVKLRMQHEHFTQSRCCFSADHSTGIHSLQPDGLHTTIAAVEEIEINHARAGRGSFCKMGFQPNPLDVMTAVPVPGFGSVEDGPSPGRIDKRRCVTGGSLDCSF